MTIRVLVVAAALATAVSIGVAPAGATLPPGNAAAQWSAIAENTVVGSGAFQGEAFVYLAYVSSAMDRAVNPGERRGQSPDAAVTEAAYQVLTHYFPTQAGILSALHDEALAAVPDGPAKRNGIMFGGHAADMVIRDRADDGLQTPVASTSLFPTLTPGPGVWRLTPTAFAKPQTPWLGAMRPFVLASGDQFLPPPPPSLQSQAWVNAFREVKDDGALGSTTRTAAETATAQFWVANTNRQWGGVARSVASRLSLDVPETARLLAMVEEVAADASISFINAKYHYLWWRPVTAIDPTSVTNDGFGPTPGFDDGNPLTIEQPGWRPLITTPNHPEYPSAHSTVSSAIAEVLTRFLGTDAIEVDIQGNANLAATRHFATADAIRTDVGNARVWAGLHFRFSVEAGAAFGRAIADYDLDHAFSRGG